MDLSHLSWLMKAEVSNPFSHLHMYMYLLGSVIIGRLYIGMFILVFNVTLLPMKIRTTKITSKWHHRLFTKICTPEITCYTVTIFLSKVLPLSLCLLLLSFLGCPTNNLPWIISISLIGGILLLGLLLLLIIKLILVTKVGTYKCIPASLKPDLDQHACMNDNIPPFNYAHWSKLANGLYPVKTT